MKTASLIWLIWIAIGVTIELICLFNSTPGDTLSENVWNVYANSTWGKFAAWMFTAFLIWMAIHFLSFGKYG